MSSQRPPASTPGEYLGQNSDQDEDPEPSEASSPQNLRLEAIRTQSKILKSIQADNEKRKNGTTTLALGESKGDGFPKIRDNTVSGAVREHVVDDTSTAEEVRKGTKSFENDPTALPEDSEMADLNNTGGGGKDDSSPVSTNAYVNGSSAFGGENTSGVVLNGSHSPASRDEGGEMLQDFVLLKRILKIMLVLACVVLVAILVWLVITIVNVATESSEDSSSRAPPPGTSGPAPSTASPTAQQPTVAPTFPLTMVPTLPAQTPRPTPTPTALPKPSPSALPTGLDFVSDCVSAINAGAPGNYSTTGSTTGLSFYSDLSGFSCGTSITTGGRWYRLTGSGATLTATTCGPSTNYDTKIHVFSGGCGAGMICVAGDDDDTCSYRSTASRVNWFAASGETYHVFVSGYGSASGTFSLYIGPPAPSTPPPTPTPVPTLAPSPFPTRFPTPFPTQFTLQEMAQMFASDAAADDLFGTSVALSGDTLVVGSPGDQNDAGSAYVFVQADDLVTWNQQAKLTASDGSANDEFGTSVAISGDTIVVGAWQNDENGPDSGSAYVYTRSGMSAWIEQEKLTASDGAAGDAFGVSVAIEEQTIVVGAHGSDENGVDDGSVYVFVQSGTSWSEEAKLVPNEVTSGDRFGTSVALNADSIVVGAPYNRTAYVFVRTGTVWSQQASLTSDSAVSSDSFGASVAISQDTVVVGSPADDDDGGPDSGSAYIFVRLGTVWSEQAKLMATDAASESLFGNAVAVNSDVVVVGSRGDSKFGSLAGSAYIFSPLALKWTERAKLVASNGAAGDELGGSVAISADTVIVGASLSDQSGPSSGSVYAFDVSSTDAPTPSPSLPPPTPIPTLIILQEEFILTASDPAPSDNFGTSVAVSGDTIVVGAPEDDDNGSSSGSAYVFVKTNLTWIQQAKLIASDGASFDDFGKAVAISANTIVVGAPGDNNPTTDSGSAYVFQRSGTTWSEWAKLSAVDGDAYDQFGHSVAVEGDTILVGSWHDDDNGMNSGSVYVFVRASSVSSSWIQQAKLLANDGDVGDSFGTSVAISGDTAVVGALNDDDNGINSGSVYVFTRSNVTWSQEAKVTADDGSFDDIFGRKVAISGNTFVVGAQRDNDQGYESGSAYVFSRSGTTWTQEAKLLPFDGEAGEWFGYSVAIFHNVVVVGASRDDVPGPRRGSASVFVRTGGLWSQQAKLLASDGASYDYFGESVAVGDIAIVVGAFNSESGSGSAYTFEPPLAASSTPSPTPSPTPASLTLEEVLQLLASDGAADDFFGTSVSFSGDTLVVGAPGDRYGRGNNAGSVYVYVQGDDLITWNQEAKLTASDGASNDEFGITVAVSGDTLVVGAWQDDETGSNSGSAYVFTRSGTTWSEQAILTASNGAAGDAFGVAVAIDNETIVVGAYRSDGGGADSGSAYIFSGSGAVWSEQAILTASDAAAGDGFGGSVAVSSDTVVVGAPSGATAYVFTKSGTSWNQQAVLAGNTTNGSFGASVAINQDTVVVGAPTDDEGGSDRGSAYIFSRLGAAWSEQTKIMAGDTSLESLFGGSVAINAAGVVVVGARGENSLNSLAGSAYVFSLRGTEWWQQAKLMASDGVAGDELGISVAIGDNAVFAGAWLSDQSGSSSGSVYTFELVSTASPTEVPTSLPSPTSTPTSTLSPSTLDFVSDCSSATYAGVLGTFNTTGSTVGLPSYFDLPSRACGTGITTGGRWYRLTGSGTTLTATTCGPNTNYDTRIHVFSGGCGDGLTCVAGNDDWSCSYPGLPSRVSWFATSGEIYFVFVSGYGSRSGNYSLYIGDPTSSPPTPLPSPPTPPTPLLSYSPSTIPLSSSPSLLPSVLTLHEVAILRAFDAGPSDFFGQSISIDGTTIVVGSPADDDNGSSSGSAYVYTKTGTAWTLEAKLQASDGRSLDYFGFSVAISGDIIVVGAYGNNGIGTDSGGAYVFSRIGTTWSQQAKLTATDASSLDEFGVSVAIFGETIVVGALSDDSGLDSGSAYIFERVGTSWVQQAKLIASDVAAGAAFGRSVAIFRDTVVVGAVPLSGTHSGNAYVFVRTGTLWSQQARLSSDSPPTSVDVFGRWVSIHADTIVVGAQWDDEIAYRSGSAYVFVHDGATWTQEAKLVPLDGGAEQWFGNSVAVMGNTIVVGAAYEGASRGSAYVFTRSGTFWSQQAKLLASDRAPFDFLGEPVAISNTTVVVGVTGDDLGELGESGSAFVFELNF